MIILPPKPNPIDKLTAEIIHKHNKFTCQCICHSQPGVMHIMDCCQFTYQQRTFDKDVPDKKT